jgi:amino acid transporter
MATKHKKQLTVERKELPTNALWAGAIIAFILCTTSLLELFVTTEKMSTVSLLWTVFVICFTAYYCIDFAQQIRDRRSGRAGK